MPKGAAARARRRQRRASHNGAEGSNRAPGPVVSSLAAGATAFRDYPLSARDRAWDGGAALQRWESACGVGGDSPDWSRFHNGFFWFDSEEPQQITAHHLGFVDVTAGKTQAVWRGVTAVAAIMQGSRGARMPYISGADKDRIRAHIERYYAKARSVYDDPTIEVPWSSDGSKIDRPDEYAVLALAHAEVRRSAPDAEYLDRVRHWAEEFDLQLEQADAGALTIGGVSYELREKPAEQLSLERATAVLAAVTDADVITDEEGNPIGIFVADPKPEQVALERARELLQDFAVETCECGHAEMAHMGPDNAGACSIENCSCEEFTLDDEMEAAAEPLEVEVKPEDLTVDAMVRFATTAASEHVRNALDRTFAEVEVDETVAEQISDRFTFHLENLEVEEAMVPSQTAGLRWRALIVPEGTLTDDGRAFAPGSISWRELPLTLGAMLDTPHADVVTKSEACGRIDRIYRDGPDVRAEGIFDPGEYGQKIAAMVTDKTLRGISVDVAVQEAETALRSEFFDENGVWREERQQTETEVDIIDILFGDNDGSDPPIFVVMAGTIGSITICPFPAFADAKIEIAASLVAAAAPNIWTVTQQHGMVVVGGLEARGLDLELVASAVEEAVAVRPPATWFEDPRLEELTPLTVADDGRVYGHAAGWGICHLAMPESCQTAPHSITDYDYFLLKEVVCDSGERVPVGTITLGTGHAGRGLNAEAATAHYDDTGTAVADVATGEDEFGIWFAGALRPGLDEERVRELRGAVLSGDWRRVDVGGGVHNLELVGLLAVNVPGFPIPRPRALLTASGEGDLELVALVAAGTHMGASEEARLNKIRALVDVTAGKYDAILSRLKEEAA